MVVLLVSALACRSGHFSRTKGYTGREYMKYRDVDIELVEDIGARSTLNSDLSVEAIA